MKSVLSLFGVIALFGLGLPVQGSEDSFPCTKLAEILPDAALTFAQEYFAWKNPDKINVSTYYSRRELYHRQRMLLPTHVLA